MADDERLAELLLDWEDHFQHGQDIPAEELCDDGPGTERDWLGAINLPTGHGPVLRSFRRRREDFQAVVDDLWQRYPGRRFGLPGQHLRPWAQHECRGSEGLSRIPTPFAR
jgi:hypothetical protein